MFTLVTVNHPDDLDGTDIPLIDGDLPGIASYLTPGTYLGTSQDFADGVEQGDATPGTITVYTDRMATFRPFARTAETRGGFAYEGDVSCGDTCGAMGEDDNVHDYAPLTIGTMADHDLDHAAVHCTACGETVLDYDHAGGTADVHAALRAATGAPTVEEGTGGNCSRVVALLPDGRRVWVTDGDAFRPDGIGLWAALADSDDDDEPTVVYEGAHDPVALYRAVRRALTEAERVSDDLNLIRANDGN